MFFREAAVLLLDTNVISELRKVRVGKANSGVAIWADSIEASDLYLSAITVLELEHGVMLVERRDPAQGVILRAWLEGQVLPEFEARILPIDTVVARRCAALHVPGSRSERDALIAATALIHGVSVVTRNVGDFERQARGSSIPERKLLARTLSKEGSVLTTIDQASLGVRSGRNEKGRDQCKRAHQRLHLVDFRGDVPDGVDLLSGNNELRSQMLERVRSRRDASA